MTTDRDRTVVQDPTVVKAVGTDGEEHRGDVPHGNYRRIEIHTPEGDETAIDVGDELHDDSGLHGEVTSIKQHHDDGHTATWTWTVYFQYADDRGTEGGVPLGELATQLDGGAWLQEPGAKLDGEEWSE